VSVTCPNCHKSLQLKGLKPGRFKPKCPRCGQAFQLTVPAEPGKEPVAAPLPAKPAPAPAAAAPPPATEPTVALGPRPAAPPAAAAA
jgi:hypothetical protein